MTLAVVVATGVAAGRVRLAEYRRWRSAPVMARVPIGGRPIRGLERFVSDEMIYAGFWRFPRADIRPPGQWLAGGRAFAKAASARCFQLRHHDSRAMVGIGTRFWSSVDWSTP